jgi:hypothetical protein
MNHQRLVFPVPGGPYKSTRRFQLTAHVFVNFELTSSMYY